MHISQQGIALIKANEGFSAMPYTCPAGKSTIGYGHVIRDGETYPNKVITKAEAENLLMQDIKPCENAINRNVKIPLSQNQFDALLSLTYNIGVEAFEK